MVLAELITEPVQIRRPATNRLVRALTNLGIDDRNQGSDRVVWSEPWCLPNPPQNLMLS